MSDDTGLLDGAWQPGPSVLAAEENLVGAAVSSTDLAAEVLALVTPANFFRGAHQITVEAVAGLLDKGTPVTPTSVLHALERAGMLAKMGGGVQLASWFGRASLAIEHDAGIVADDAARRDTRVSLQTALQLTADPAFTVATHLDRIRQVVDDATATTSAGTARWLADAVHETIDQLDQPLPADELTPPYADLRDIVPALRPGQLITIAGRPSIGKSLVAGDFARWLARHHQTPGAWFSLEMSRDEIVTRIISAEARIDQERLQRRSLTDADWDRINNSAQTFGGFNLLIDDEPGCTVAHARTQLRAMSRTMRPRFAVFDYVQLMSSPGAQSRQEEVSRLARGLKELAKEFELPVLMAAQLNRNPESRHDKRPLQADLRESGEIENSSDVVILLHREDYYEPESPRAGEMDLIVSKNRNGRTGTCTVAFQGRYCRCVDLAPEWTPTKVLGDVA